MKHPENILDAAKKKKNRTNIHRMPALQEGGYYHIVAGGMRRAVTSLLVVTTNTVG